MSSYLSSYFIEPALRQARRFSSPRPESRDPSAQPSQPVETPGEQSLPPAREDDDSQEQGEEAQSFGSRAAQPGQISLGNLRETYSHEADRYHAEELVETERDAGVARENGMQGVLPLNDVRSNYLFDEEPLQSPAELPQAQNEDSSMRSLRQQEQRTIDSLSSMSLDDRPSMTSNPQHAVSHDLMSIGDSNSSMSSRSRRQAQFAPNARQTPSRQGSALGGIMSQNLPEDDGMKALRQQMHQIREMALSSEEKAKRMHELMTADYAKLRKQKVRSDEDIEKTRDSTNQISNGTNGLEKPTRQPRASSPHGTTISAGGDSCYVTADDIKPTYQPRRPAEEREESSAVADEDDREEEEQPLGCPHYRRNVKIQCPDCYRWYTCRHCHDEAEKHPLNRSQIRSILCMFCATPQRAAEYCKNCGELTASYYCNICKLWDNDTSHKIYHCPDCGICRRGEGLGKDYYHCKRCNVCINIAYAAGHRCVERATECDCPICGEWMFTSSTMVVAVQCGHYMHRPCHDALMRSSFKCPICNRSAVNMDLQWRKLDQAIEMQPMPSQFKDTQAFITCNDCSARTHTSFHWLGNKCTECDSYNTNQIRLINTPSDQELQALTESREVQALREAERQLGTQDGNAIADAPATQTRRRRSGPGSRPRSRQSSQPSGLQPLQPMQPLHTQQPATATQQPYLADPVSPLAPTTLHNPVNPNDPTSTTRPATSYFPTQGPPTTQSRSVRASTTTPPDHEMTELTDTDDLDSIISDDVSFWGEPVSPTSWSMPSVSPTGWSMPSMPQIPTVPHGEWRANWPRMPSVSMPSMPSMPGMPSMPSVPGMPAMPSGDWRPDWPQMPRMPSVSVPRAISPTTIWAAGSPTFGGWNLPSPRFFPMRRRRERGGCDGDGEAGGEDEDEGEDGESESSSEDEEEEGGKMELDGEEGEDEDVDEMAIFGHR